MTYPEAIQFLYDLSLFGMNPGLENTRRLAALAGNPHEKLRFIHVAGTNGKGSTCAMLESIYRAAGLRVGMFTSPHLVSFRERIQVNRQMISEEGVVQQVSDFKGWIETRWPPRPPTPVAAGFSLRPGAGTTESSAGLKPDDSDSAVPVGAGRKLKLAATAPTAETAPHPTFFEVLTVMALRYFAGRNCDLVIWETGLGGRLDATNIVTPLASVITNIGFDHQQWLGDTLAKIAFEKAGIIKPGVPVITAADELEALEVIRAAAAEMNAPLTIVHPADIELGLAGTLALPLLGVHQQVNAAVALATVQTIQDRIAVSADQIRHGLETVKWPGRFQVITDPAGRTIVLDGAHNSAGAAALREAMQSRFPGVRPTLVLGVLKDKDQSGICGALAPIASRILLTPVNSDRTATPGELREWCAKANPSAELETCGSLAQALDKAANDPMVLIAGSLYLIGETLELLKLSSAGIENERGLNEWSPKK